MTHPQQPYGYPQFGGPPDYGRPGHGGYAPATPPSAAGLTAAAVLALVAGLWQLGSAILQLLSLGSLYPGAALLFGAQASASAVVAVLLLVGGILMFAGKPVGRWLALTGAGLFVLAGIIFTVVIRFAF